MQINEMENNFLSKETAINEIDDRVRTLKNRSVMENVSFHDEIYKLEKEKDELYEDIFADLSPYEIVKIARHPLRPSSTDYIALIVDNFTELHGDRRFGDDKAILTGIGTIGGKKVLVIAHCKGKSTKERISCNFGMPNPGRLPEGSVKDETSGEI